LCGSGQRTRKRRWKKTERNRTRREVEGRKEKGKIIIRKGED
jgi:hypothetical protein